MSEQSHGPALLQRGDVLLAIAAVCALLVVAVGLAGQQRPVLVTTSCLIGAWAAWRATQAWRTRGRRLPMAVAATLCGFLAVGFLFFALALLLVVLQGGVF